MILQNNSKKIESAINKVCLDLDRWHHRMDFKTKKIIELYKGHNVMMPTSFIKVTIVKMS